MNDLAISDLTRVVGGEIVARGHCDVTAGLTTDSRAVVPGCLFWALSGERFDGNSFAAEASRRGAAAVVVSRVEGDFAPGCSVVRTDDTLAALQRLASWWRGELEPLHVVGLTGSSGKTSVKDMTRSVLAERYRTCATQGNLNNHIGVPLSILTAEKGVEAAVWEMGMNHAGELAPLCAMVRPHIGVITTIGSAHLEFLGSRDRIAEEKCTVARSLPEEGWMIYPAGDDYAAYIASQTKATPIPVGGADSPVRALRPRASVGGTSYDLYLEGLGEIPVSLPVPGAHMVGNSLLAAAVGWKLGCSLQQIAAGLSSAALTKGRLACRKAGDYTVVDDTYNANPESMRAALETVASLRGEGRCLAVLGKMGELGPTGVEAHAGVGRLAASLGYVAVVVVGAVCEESEALCAAAAEGTAAFQLPSPAEAAEVLRGIMQPGDVILFKGSRSTGMEKTMYELFPHLKASL